MSIRGFCICVILVGCSPLWASEVALVTLVQGRVLRLVEAAALPVEAFVKLKDGDRLSLEKGGRLQLVYFDSGRQETWSGPGRLELTPQEGKASGLAPAEVKSLPLVMARQLARTPALDSQGRGGVTRLRSVPNPDALSKLEDNYKDLRSQAAADDLGPEMYLLSGLFEMRELDRLERVLDDLQQKPAAAQLISFYRQALRNARDGKN